jgi:pyrimidine-nucleoside phosphorylase
VNFVEIIARKRDGGELSAEEIRTFIRGATSGAVADEQLAALLMAICIRGASGAETRALVEAMSDSGVRWRLEEASAGVVDKHSTGGVGDSVSLVFAPLLAACGVPVAMMAGASLGHTQGTLDKLAAVPGFAPARNRAEALERLGTCGAVFAAQSAEIAPADRRLYALRDVTATVPSLPLIVASIMSKKLAVGAGRLVLDVKWGSGAFRKTLEEASALAEALADVARAAGVRTSVLITDMDEPLGRKLGCASEVRNALAVLEGRGEERLRAVTLELAVEALVLSGRSRADARREAETALTDGRARAAWDRIVGAHGGHADPARLAQPRRTVAVPAPRAGYVAAVDGEALGWLAVTLGAGRRQQGDAVDPAAGIDVRVGTGEHVAAGEPLVVLELGERDIDVRLATERAVKAFRLADVAPPGRPLVAARIGDHG